MIWQFGNRRVGLLDAQDEPPLCHCRACGGPLYQEDLLLFFGGDCYDPACLPYPERALALPLRAWELGDLWDV